MPSYNPKIEEIRIASPVKKFYRYSVQGRGDFPVDMLRYDCCWPTTNGTATFSQWQRPGIDVAAAGYDNRVVELTGIQKPTLDRWRSFGWIVTSY